MRFLKLSLVLVGLAAASPAFARDEAVSLKSGYLGDGVAGGHFVTIKGKLGGAGELILDRNSFSLNAFGDITRATEMAAVPIAIKILRSRAADPKGQGRRLFEIKGAPEGQWSLVVPKGAGAARLIVVHKGRTRIIPMRAQAREAKGVKEKPVKGKAKKDAVRGKPRSQLGRDAKYSAVYKDGELIVTARGTAPTIQYTIALEDGDKPGQYEFWWIPPDGPVIMVLPPPFEVQARTKMAARPKTVTIRDRDGLRTIPVS